MHQKNKYALINEADHRLFKKQSEDIRTATTFNTQQQTQSVGCFIPLNFYVKKTDKLYTENVPIYLAVSFPESQLFMDQHQDEIYLINDEAGIEKYGHAAYFVEEGLYKRTMKPFEREVTKASSFDLNL